MNTNTALRQADPGRRLPSRDPDERLLAEILASTPHQTAPTTARSDKSAKRDWRPLVATAFVAVAVSAVAIVAIRLPSASNHGPASTATPPATSRTALEDAVFAKLNEVATGDLPVRQKSDTTWSDTFAGGDGGALDLTGKTLYIAAACDGGGTIAVQLTGHKDRTLDCTTPSTLGPINLTSEISSKNDSAGLNVVTVTGHPRYIAKAMAFPTPTSTPNP